MSDGSSRVLVGRAGSRYPEALERVERQAEAERARGLPLTRRQLLRTGSGVLVASVIPVQLTGCGEGDVSRYIVMLAELVQLLSGVIKGDLKFSDSECRLYQVALDLFQSAGNPTGVAVTNGLMEFRHCDSESVRRIEEANLRAQASGSHIIQARYAGQNWLSNNFQVRQE